MNKEITMYKDGKIEDVIIKSLVKYQDTRGWLSELFRADELSKEFIPTMAYISQTEPNIARGPHEHKSQADFFCFIGPSTFRIYLWDARTLSPTYGNRVIIEAGEDNPLSVIVPAGIVHAYKNIGTKPGWVLNFPNKLYAGHGRKEIVDEIRHEDDVNSLFKLD